MSGYQDLIRAAGVPEGDTDQTEEIMRTATGGTLDHLTRREFLSLAREAHEALLILRSEGVMA